MPHRRLTLLEHIKSSTKIFADETRALVLDPGRGRTKNGQLWAYARDDRPWCGSDPQAYMADVLTKIVDGHLASKLDELMPWAYAPPAAPKDVA